MSRKKTISITRTVVFDECLARRRVRERTAKLGEERAKRKERMGQAWLGGGVDVF
jgi:hypothetical protein